MTADAEDTTADTPVSNDTALPNTTGFSTDPGISTNTGRSTNTADGRFVTDEHGEAWYRIRDYDLLDPFLVNVVTSDDQWIYVSTSGALTAGRRSAEHALFPYETDDRLHRSGGITGPLTIIRAATIESHHTNTAVSVWQPFDPTTPHGTVRRALAKSVTGNRLRFEEHHPDLGLTFAYTWAAAGAFGLVRHCSLTLDDQAPPVEIELLDGLLDVLPAGVELQTQQSSSTLVDAYRRSELDTESGLALFTLEALISDRADPAEALSASVVWSAGLDRSTVTLSDRQVRDFRSGRGCQPDHLVTGRKGAFIQTVNTTLGPSETLRWLVGADVDQDHAAVAELQHRLRTTPNLPAAVAEAIDESTAELTRIVAEADGVQMTADRHATVHHFANTLFNCMRGGVPLNDHRIDLDKLTQSVQRRNRVAGDRLASALDGLDTTADVQELRAAVANDGELSRLVSEYLPLTFSRRHGDPSRPWNTFHIPRRVPGAGPSEGYEGNWRDIFQNWDALIHSFPNYIPSVISKFLNASTMDGNNPYRITDQGIEWEEPEDGSWGNFGYWGDHQIVYLYRLLLAAERFHPGWLTGQLTSEAFSYGDVPYRLLPYPDLVADPKQTIVFDGDRQAAIEARVKVLGTDGRLVPVQHPGAVSGGSNAAAKVAVHQVTMIEKLLVPALAKLSNLVAGAGIWMNTQRPEWNDANNALVGNGVSTVTLFHLRDYLDLIDSLLVDAPASVTISESVLQWMTELEGALGSHQPEIPTASAGDSDRRRLLDHLGEAYSAYRSNVYDHGPGAPAVTSVAALRSFLAMAKPHLDHAAASAATPSGLFHAYWLLHLTPGSAELTPLYEMLEGQAAALGTTDRDSASAIQLIDTLAESTLYRADQRSYVLYPNRPPTRFVDKNRIPADENDPVVGDMLELGVARRSVDGAVRFAPELASGRHLEATLDRLEADPALRQTVASHRRAITKLYEDVFRHRAFTGRSQTMYRYEGLGSVYWHMVSKLLYALQDRVTEAVTADEDKATIAELADRYHQVRSGLGFMKSVVEQGSFPTDPHSHTPSGAGAQQPGMTGQVKEGVLIRLGELGVHVRSGTARFSPVLLDPAEFLSEDTPWQVLGRNEMLPAGSLGFTYCGVPVVYHLTDDQPWVSAHMADGDVRHGEETRLDRETSAALFSRTGQVTRIDVGVSRGALQLGART